MMQQAFGRREDGEQLPLQQQLCMQDLAEEKQDATLSMFNR